MYFVLPVAPKTVHLAGGLRSSAAPGNASLADSPPTLSQTSIHLSVVTLASSPGWALPA
ncbi:hypothetical protein [Pseudomonas sp. Teo4]|uniref:hypothetical protein n=1 Tax=Pseudomonas sp. Teo4 TaxID=3064528 RepID=UPI002ABC900C|nr:hypothetical protein [Pseudomonas sp. Teo4]MDZ3992974.1 hypothetical protein [Pseudomonas sp. Teo4]